MFCWCHFSHGLWDRSCRGSEARAVRYCLYSALQHSTRAAKRSFLTSSKGRKQWASALGHHLAKPEGCQDREHLFRYGTREKACEKQVLCLGPSLLQLLCASAALECTLLQSMCLLKRRTWYFSILRNSGIDSGSLRGNTARGLKMQGAGIALLTDCTTVLISFLHLAYILTQCEFYLHYTAIWEKFYYTIRHSSLNPL